MSSVNCGLEMPPSSGSLRPCPIVIFDEVPPPNTPVPPLMHGICPDARTPAKLSMSPLAYRISVLQSKCLYPSFAKMILGPFAATKLAQIAVLLVSGEQPLCSTCMLIVSTII